MGLQSPELHVIKNALSRKVTLRGWPVGLGLVREHKHRQDRLDGLLGSGWHLPDIMPPVIWLCLPHFIYNGQNNQNIQHPVVILLHLCYGYLPQSISCALLYPVPTSVPLGGGYDSVEPGWFTEKEIRWKKKKPKSQSQSQNQKSQKAKNQKPKSAAHTPKAKSTTHTVLSTVPIAPNSPNLCQSGATTHSRYQYQCPSPIANTSPLYSLSVEQSYKS